MSMNSAIMLCLGTLHTQMAKAKPLKMMGGHKAVRRRNTPQTGALQEWTGSESMPTCPSQLLEAMTPPTNPKETCRVTAPGSGCPNLSTRDVLLCSVHSRMLSRIHGLCPLDANSFPQVMTAKTASGQRQKSPQWQKLAQLRTTNLTAFLCQQVLRASQPKCICWIQCKNCCPC